VRSAKQREAHRRSRRLRRVAVVLAGVALCLLATAWVLPRVSSAAAEWLDEEPVRGRTVDVDGLEPGAAPPGVELPPPEDASGRSEAEEEGSPEPDDASSDASPELWPETAVVDGGVTFNLLGAVGRFEPGAVEERGAVELRTSPDGESWSDWTTMELAAAPIDQRPLDESAGAEAAGADGAAGESEDGGPDPATDTTEPVPEKKARELVAEPVWVGEARYVEFRTTGPVADLKFTFINSLGDATLADRLEGALKSAVATIADVGRTPVAAAMASKPAIVTRANWGANESWRRCDPGYADVKMAFIHHTVTGNSYSRSEAPAVVRAVYYYHARSCGFNDIGYNFLIDRYGTIYEGRYGGVDKGVVGAQTLGFNTGSTGISLIGDFSGATPPSAAITSLKKLLAWKFDVHHVDPTSAVTMYCGSSDKYRAGQYATFPSIAGHRDACYTSCPGARLYAKLPAVRSSVDTMGRPKIYAPRVSRSVISPNGDGQDDTTKVTFKANEPVGWQVRITDAGGAVVRSYSGNGTSVSRTWDGTADAGGTTTAPAEPTVEANDLFTEALRNFRLDRGDTAVFRYAVRYGPPEGETDAGVTADVVLKVRDDGGASRLTKRLDGVPVNSVRTYAQRCWLAPGYYTYSIYATLSDGTPQQSVGRGRMVVRNVDGTMPAAEPSEEWLAVGAAGSSGEPSGSGTTGGGALVPDGSYTVKVTASSSRGNARAATMSVIVDTEPPRIEDFSLSPSTVGRQADSTRERCRVRYRLSEYSRTRVTIRHQDGGRVRTVSDYRWVGDGVRNVYWDGTIEFKGQKIPAPDGRYQVLVEAKDLAGSRTTETQWVTLESDPVKWGDGATFVTKATRNFGIRRGRKAVFRFMALYAPPVGEAAPYSRARITLKVRDANGRSRHTKIWTSAPLNRTLWYSIRRCWLKRGTYRYHIYARLPDGTRQQLIGSGTMRIR